MNEWPFTPQWAAAFAAAQAVAAQMSHDTVSAAHLVVGLLSLPATALRHAADVLGVDHAEVQAQVAASHVGAEVGVVALRAIEVSVHADHYYFGTDHLAVALASLPEIELPALVQLRELCTGDAAVANCEEPILCYLAGVAALSARRFESAQTLLAKARDGFDGASGSRREYADAAFNLGLAYQGSGAVGDAAQSLQRARAAYADTTGVASAEGLEYKRALCAFGLARVLQRLGDHVQAVQCFQEALSTYVTLPGADSHLARSAAGASLSCIDLGLGEQAIDYARVARSAYSAWVWGRPAGAIEYCDQLVARYQAAINHIHRGNGTFDQFNEGMRALREGIAHHSAREIKLGLAVGREAADKFESMGAKRQLADSRQLIAALLAAGGHHDLAEADLLYKRALAAFEELGLFTSCADVERGRGYVAERTGATTRAIQHYSRANEYALRAGDRRRGAEAVMQAARLYSAAQQHGDAITAYGNAEHLYTLLRHPDAASCALQIAEVWRQLPGEYPTAKENYLRASARYLDFEDGGGATQALQLLVGAALVAAEFDDAWTYANTAVTQAATYGVTISDNLRRLPAGVVEYQGGYCAEQQRFSDAAAHHQRAAELCVALPWREGVASNLRRAARAHFLNDELPSAAALFETVLTEYADVLAADVHAGVLMNYGTVLGLLEQKEKGRAVLQDSLQRFTDLGLDKAAADVAANLRALDGQGESIHQGDPAEIAAAKAHLDEARTLALRGEHAAALEHSREALRTYRDAGRSNDSVTAAVMVAQGQRDLGAAQQALDELMPCYVLPLDGVSLVRLNGMVGTLMYELRRTGEAERYLRKALSGAQQVPWPKEIAANHHELGLLYTSLGRHDYAVREHEAAISVYRESINDPSALISILLDAVPALRGYAQYGRAHTLLDEADALLGPKGPEFLRTRCVHLRAQVYFDEGRLADAEAGFARAEQMHRAAGRIGKALEARADLGEAMARRGDADAIAVLESTLDGPVDTTVEGRRARAIKHCRVASAFGRRDQQKALQHLAIAREIYDAIGDAAAVQAIDHEVAGSKDRAGRPEAAEAVYEQAVAEARRPGSSTVSLASALTGLGLAYRRNRKLDEALQAYGEARELFYTAGRLIDAADCDISAAAITGSMQQPYQDVLAELLPAAIFLDGQRHQFSDAQQRHGWRTNAGQSKWAFGRALEAAHRAGDHRAVANIVEFLINSGVHSASADDDGDANALLSDPSGSDESADIAPPPQVTAGDDGGALRLVAGARLPMSAAPRLQWPDGELVLSPYVEESDLRYAPIVRPPTVTI